MAMTLYGALDDFEVSVGRLNDNIAFLLLKINEVDSAIAVVRSLSISLDAILRESKEFREPLVEESLTIFKYEMRRSIEVVDDAIRRILGLIGVLADEVRQRLVQVNAIVLDVDPLPSRVTALGAALADIESTCARLLAHSNKQLTLLDLLKQRA